MILVRCDVKSEKIFFKFYMYVCKINLEVFRDFRMEEVIIVRVIYGVGMEILDWGWLCLN